MTKTDLSALSTQELEELLEEKKQQEAKKRASECSEYERKRDSMISDFITVSKDLSSDLKAFKRLVFTEIERFQKMVSEYGNVRSNSKGGYSLKTKDNRFKVVYERNIVNEFDERADKALELIKDFLESTVKKRDLKTYKIINKLLSRNKAGDLNASRVVSLISLRNEYKDERWVEAMTLLEESYNDRPISYGISFYEKNDKTEKYEQIKLNFTSIDI